MKTRLQTLFSGLILLIALSLGFYSCASVDMSESKALTLKHGKVIVKEIGGVKFHTYMVQGMVSHIIETHNCLILQDTVRQGSHNEELKHYLESVGKPLNRIIISHGHDHHWIGLEMFRGVPIYANAETIKEIQEICCRVMKQRSVAIEGLVINRAMLRCHLLHQIKMQKCMIHLQWHCVWVVAF